MSSYRINKKLYIWHNTRGSADEYWLVKFKDHKVIHKFSKCLGKIIYDRLEKKYILYSYKKQYQESLDKLEKKNKKNLDDFFKNLEKDIEQQLGE